MLGRPYLLNCRPRKVTQRLFIDGGWWMVDILSLMIYIKFGCHHHPPTFHRKSLNPQEYAQYGPGEVGRGKRRCGRVSIDHLRVTVGHCRSL